jgi:hypothetical protein
MTWLSNIGSPGIPSEVSKIVKTRSSFKHISLTKGYPPVCLFLALVFRVLTAVVSILILVTCSYSQAATARGSKSCSALFSHVKKAVDFPIEEYLPGLTFNKIPYNHLAFKVWRARSSPSVPDFMFLLHYLKLTEVRDELWGFRARVKESSSQRPVNLELPIDAQAILDNYISGSDAYIYKYTKRRGGIETILRAATQSHLTVAEYLESLGIKVQFSLSELKTVNQDARFILNEFGQVFVWPESNTQVLKQRGLENVLVMHDELFFLVQELGFRGNLVSEGYIKFYDNTLRGFPSHTFPDSIQVFPTLPFLDALLDLDFGRIRR